VRVKISLTPLSDNTSLELNYNYHLASLIYRSIQRANKKLSLELHSPSGPKLFTFSRLFVPERRFRIEGERMILEDGSAHFFFSSPRSEICEALVEGILMKPEVRIGAAEFLVSELEVLREEEIGAHAKFVTLSPINVSSVETRGNSRCAVDLYPNDQRFYEILRSNLMKKYELIHGRPPDNTDLRVKPLKVKPKRIRVKNTYHRCVEMVFDAEGSSELLEIGYKAGFGNKNSMGFGMVKVA